MIDSLKKIAFLKVVSDCDAPHTSPIKPQQISTWYMFLLFCWLRAVSLHHGKASDLVMPQSATSRTTGCPISNTAKYKVGV
jgi:hypothetical protein